MAASAVTVGNCNAARRQALGKESGATCRAEETGVLAGRGALGLDVALDRLHLRGVALLIEMHEIPELARFLLQAVDEGVCRLLDLVGWLELAQLVDHRVEENLRLVAAGGDLRDRRKVERLARLVRGGADAVERGGEDEDEECRQSRLLHCHPPIWLIERDARTNPGSLMRCFSSLWRTAHRSNPSSSSSDAPRRSGSLRSHSRRENRQVRSRPSAVSRIRSQEEQNGSETGLTNPISPAPSAKRYRRAVEEAFAGISTRGQRSWIRARISAPVSTSSWRQASSASSGMNSMKRTTYGFVRASSASAGTSSSVKPRIATQLTLIGRSSG